MANVSALANSGSLYEQLISQVLAVESQPRLKLKTEKSEQGVYKAVLSDFTSRVSGLNSVLDKLGDPFRAPFESRSAQVGSNAGFAASADDGAAAASHEIHVIQLARADARLSKQVVSAATDIADLFVDAGDPAAEPPTPDTVGTRSFTIHVAQPEGDPVDVAVSFTSPEGATNDDVLVGIAAAVNSALAAAEADGLLAEGTGVSASVVRETGDTARLSLRGTATGYGNRLTFTDPDGLLAALEVDRQSVRSGAGGGAIYDVGASAQDSALNAAFTLDGLDVYRESNTVDDALDGLTLTLTKPTTEAATLTVGADAKGMRSEVDAFIKAYNGLVSFLSSKSAVDPDAGTRGVFAGDASVRGLRNGLRSDLGRAVGEGPLRTLADLGIETARDGTLSVTDSAALTDALSSSPDAVAALFQGEGGLVERLSTRIGGLLGAKGSIEQRRSVADSRIQRLDSQIARWDARLTRRGDSLRAQFAQLEAISLQAESQFASLSSLFYF